MIPFIPILFGSALILYGIGEAQRQKGKGADDPKPNQHGGGGRDRGGSREQRSDDPQPDRGGGVARAGGQRVDADDVGDGPRGEPRDNRGGEPGGDAPVSGPVEVVTDDGETQNGAGKETRKRQGSSGGSRKKTKGAGDGQSPEKVTDDDDGQERGNAGGHDDGGHVEPEPVEGA